MAHRHEAQVERTVPWTYCTAKTPANCDGVPHGNVVIRETCACGAVRETERNAGREASTGWFIPSWGVR